MLLLLLQRLKTKVLRYALIMLTPEQPIQSALSIKDTGTSASIVRIRGFTKRAVELMKVAGLVNTTRFLCLGEISREVWLAGDWRMR